MPGSNTFLSPPPAPPTLCAPSSRTQVIPKTLSVNAAQDATDLVAALRAEHFKAQTVAGEEERKFMGLDLLAGTVRDNLAFGVVEPAISKVPICVSLHAFTC